MSRHKLLSISCLIWIAILSLAYNDDPPNGRTGAPFDGNCTDCHTSNNPGGYNGTAEIIGLPDTIQPNTSYSLRLKASVTAGIPVRAGFQLVVTDQSLQNAGDLTAINAETDTEFLNGREYLDHRGGKFFGGMPVFWDFTWTSPESADCNQLIFFYTVNFCNGSGDFGDFTVPFSDTIYFAGGLDTIAPTVICPSSISVCANDTVRYSKPVVSDNCGQTVESVVLLAGLPSETVFPEGTSTQVFQATDKSGNTATCSFEVQVNPPLQIEVDSIVADQTNTGTGSIAISVFGGTGGPYSFTWEKDGALFAVDEEDLSDLFSGTYTLEVQDSLGCSARSTHIVFGNIVGAHEPQINTPTLFPQPLIGDWFSIIGCAESPDYLNLYNNSGQWIRSLPLAHWPGPFELKELPAGVYVLQLQWRDGKQSALRMVK